MSVSSVSNRIRITGLASGMDTETMVSDLMKAEKLPLNKMMQSKQVNEWKRDDYRTITNALSDFSKAYMNVINPTTNMTSSASYKKFSASITDAVGTASTNIFSATGNSTATVGSKTVTVTQLATTATEKSSTTATAPLKSGSLSGAVALNGKKMMVSLDGVSKEITFTKDYTIDSQEAGDALAADMQTLISNTFGKGLDNLDKVSLSFDNSDGKLLFSTGNGANKITLSSATSNDAISTLGITTGVSNRLDTSKTLLQLKDSFGVSGGLTFVNDDGTDKVKFTINNKEFSFESSAKLSTIMSTINNDTTANVNVSYDSLTDKFSIAAKQTGAGQNISITNTWGNLFGSASAFNIDPTVADFGGNGKDAIVNINGQDITRGQNTFTEDGISFTLLKADPGQPKTLTLTNDSTTVFNNIKGFVDKYNEIMDKIYTKMNEKYDKNYLPLSDEQKEAMKEADITSWETKAKTGLLRNDPILQKIYNSLRSAVSDPVSGLTSSLKQIGIYSASYTDNGKLTINENKLKTAIQNDPDAVMNVFSKQSDTLPSYDRKATSAQRSSRYTEEGFANRIYDIVQDNISLVMDTGKQKGFLVEKAGISGDLTDEASLMAKQIINNQKLIDNFNSKLADKEDYYYKKFTAMETALSKLSSQSSWIASQLSSGG